MAEEGSDKDKAIALAISGLRYSYKSNWTFRRFETLKDINVNVFQGESFGFLGHNGAGKTTTIKCILSLIKPSAGKISIFGKDSRLPEARSLIGYLPEHPYFYDHLTVLEAMNMYACLAGVPRAKRSQAISRALDAVKLSSRKKSALSSLSKGLTQRVALAQAIVQQPKLLILDEPFSGLDPIGRKEFRELFFEQKKQGVTIFMSSHILSDVEFLCDRASIMLRGEIKGVYDLKNFAADSQGVYELVLKNENNQAQLLDPRVKALSSESKAEDRFTRYFFREKQAAEAALKIALEAGKSIEAYHYNHASLEDIFVRTVKNG